MSSVVIVGASRGLGFALTKIWSETPSNTVIALVRDKAAATATFEKDLPGRANVRILTADLEDFESLKAALEETRKILDNKLDYLIVNAAVSDSIVDDIGNAILNDREQFDKDMIRTFKTNCLGVAHALGLFAPLLLNGTAKKGVVISSGAGDPHWTAKWRIFGHAPYGISKAAVNQVVAAFHAQYAYEGVTISAISPGIIKTEFNTPKPDGEWHLLPKAHSVNAAYMYSMPQNQLHSYEIMLTTQVDLNYQRVQKSFGPPTQASNRFKGPYTPDESAAKVTDVIVNHLDLEVNGGTLISEYNDQQWV